MTGFEPKYRITPGRRVDRFDRVNALIEAAGDAADFLEHVARFMPHEFKDKAFDLALGIHTAQTDLANNEWRTIKPRA